MLVGHTVDITGVRYYVARGQALAFLYIIILILSESAASEGDSIAAYRFGPFAVLSTATPTISPEKPAFHLDSTSIRQRER